MPPAEVVVVVATVAAAAVMSFQTSSGVGGPGKVDAHRRAVFLGPRCTGKTSLIARAVDDKFTEAYTPTIESNMRVWQSRGDQLISITIIDSGGLELSADDGPVIPPHFCVGIDVYVLVYGVDSLSSFHDVQQIFNELVNATGLTLAGMASTTSVILVGMKADVLTSEREVPYSQGDAQAKEWGCKFLECSAKQDVRVMLQRQLDVGHPLSKLMRTPPWENANSTSASSGIGRLASQQQDPAPERQSSSRLATDLFGASGSAGSTASPGRIQNFGNCLMVFEHLMDTCHNVRQHHGASSFGPSSLPVRSGALTRGSDGTTLASSAPPSRGNSMHSRRPKGNRSSASSLRSSRGNSGTDPSRTPMLRAQPTPSYGSSKAATAGGGGGGGNGPMSDADDGGYDDDDEFDSDPDFAGSWGNESGRKAKSARRKGKRPSSSGKDRPLSNFVRHSFTLSELYPSSGRCPLCYALCSVKSHQISSAQQVLLVNATKAIAFVILGLSSVSAAGAVLILTVVTSVPDTPNGEGEGPGSGLVISSLQGVSAVLAASGAVAALQSVAGNRIERGRSCLVWLHVVLLLLSILVQMGSFVSFVAGTMGNEAGDGGGGTHEPGIRFFRDMLPEGQSSLEVFFFICLVCNVSVETVSTLLAALLKKSIQPTEAAPYNYDEAASPNYNLWTSRGQAGSDGHINPSTLSRDRIHSAD